MLPFFREIPLLLPFLQLLLIVPLGPANLSISMPVASLGNADSLTRGEQRVNKAKMQRERETRGAGEPGGV